MHSRRELPMDISQKKLNIHHIGGRFGNGGFPHLARFEKDMVRAFYDADTDCLEQIGEKQKSQAEVHIFPHCVGSNKGSNRGTFNVNYDPTSSSLYSYDPAYGSFYFFCYNHDFVVSETMRTMEKRELDIVTLDHLFSTGSIPVSPPDFLSMDVQGAEYDILQGAESLLEKNVLGLVLETWFHPVYQGQKVFGDICSYLSDRGFYFVKFLKTTEYSPYRSPVGLRGEGFQVFSDALFMRRIDSLEALDGDRLKIDNMLKKLAFIAIVHGQFEYGMECLRRINREGDNRYAPDDSVCGQFLNDLYNSAALMKPWYPKTFAEKYSFEVSKQRFAGQETLKKDAAGGGQKQALQVRLWLRYIYPHIYSIAELYDFVLYRLWAPIASLVFFCSPIERVLKRYGLKNQARQLKKARMVQSFFCIGTNK